MHFSLTEQPDSTTVFLKGDVSAGIGVILRDIGTRSRKKTLILDLSRLVSLNSIGCAEWSSAMRELVGRFMVEAVFCPVAFIDYCNAIPAILSPAGTGASVLVRSFKAPYRCPECETEVDELIELTDVVPSKTLPARLCGKCGHSLVPEVHAADFLSFLDQTL